MNIKDGQDLGLSHGDTVLIISRHGKVCRRIGLSPLVLPGVLLLGQGSWTRLDKDGIDLGGNPNVLTGSHLCGEGQSAWNTVNVRVEKWNGEPLAPDYTWSPPEGAPKGG